jgi:tyrosine-specific transport protein
MLTALPRSPPAAGLLVAEVSLRLMQQRGAGGSVSMISMASTTLGPAAAAATSAVYVFLHQALLVAYISKAGEIVGDATGLPLVPAAAGFTLAFGALCYLSSQQLLDSVNGGLVGLVVACFLVSCAAVV